MINNKLSNRVPRPFTLKEPSRGLKVHTNKAIAAIFMKKKFLNNSPV